jgi:hypothetical protein
MALAMVAASLSSSVCSVLPSISVIGAITNAAPDHPLSAAPIAMTEFSAKPMQWR